MRRILPYEAEDDDEDERMASDAGRRRRGGRLDVVRARRGCRAERSVAVPGDAPRGAQHK